MAIKINLVKAERKVAEPGRYVADIVKAEVKKSKSNSENDNLAIELLLDGDYHPEYEDLRIYTNLSQTEQSWFRTVELLKAIRGEEELQADNEEGDLEFEEDDLVGEKVVVDLSIDDKYDPKNPRNQVESFMSLAEFEAEDNEDTIEEVVNRSEEEVKKKK